MSISHYAHDPPPAARAPPPRGIREGEEWRNTRFRSIGICPSLACHEISARTRVTAQITVDTLIERWIGAEMPFDASEFIKKLDPKPPSLFLVGRKSVVDLCLGRRLVNDGSCRHRG